MAGINADYTAALKKGNWFSNLNNNYSSWAGGESFLGGGITNGALASAGMGVLNMGVNMLAGQNQTGIGNVMQTVGGLASNIPGVGGLIGAGVGVVGGLVNAAFGSHINEEFVNQTRNQANQIGSNVFNANTNADLLNDWGNLTEQSSVRKSEVGSDGWFSSKASRKTAELNRQIAEANRRQLANFNVAAENVDTQNDFRIMQNMAAYGGPINSFRKYYDKGGYLNQAKALIRQNEGWREKPYADAPKGKNWRSVGYGFNDSGFRDKYPEGISKHYEHGITKKQAEEELDYFLSKAEKQLKSIYGKQWNDFTDSQKAAILDTYYQRPASVGKSSRFYKAVTAGEDAGRYLGVAGYSRRNNIRQSVFGGAGFSGGAYEDDSKFLSYPSSILEATSPISELDLSGIEPTKVINPEINLSYPSLDLNFLTSSQKPVQQQVPTIGTVEDFLASYGDFEENLFEKGGNLYGGGGNLFLTGGPEGGGREEVTNLNTWDELAAQSPFLYTIGKALDPTGISGYGDAKEAITQYDTNPSVGNAYNAVMETLGALPIVSKAGKAIKFLQGAITGQGIFNDYDHAKEQQQKYGDELVVDYWDNTVKPRREAEKHAEQIKAKMSYGDVNHVPSFKLAPKDSKLGQIIHDYNDNHRVVKKYKKVFGGNLFEDGGELNNKDMNIFDFGGGLTHGIDWDTGINWVNEGGSHGENPLGGVPMGIDEQGIPNLVEEGEAIWNGDYVFSKRMKVPKKLREKYSLPDDATFADAVAKLTKNSDERPLSPIDRNTQNYILGEFADTQEEMRMAKAQRAMDRQQQLQDDFLMGMQFGLGGHMSPVGIVPDSDNVSLFDELENSFADGGGIHIDPSKKGTFKAQASKMGMGVQEAASHILAHKKDYSPEMVKKANFAKVFAHADGGDLFSNPFAYGGELGNVFAGEGDRPNTLNLDAANQSLVRRIFGDTGFTRFMENTAEAINDPIGYFAGDEIDAVIDKLGKMSEPQLEKFFRTDIGRAIAPYLAGDDNSQVQKAGMRGAKSVANIVRRVQRPVQIAAKKAMAQSRQAARGQMRTPKGGGSQKVLNETTTPVQQVRQPIRDSGLPEGWGVGSSNLGRASGRTQAFQRGLPKDTFDKGFGSARNLAGTMDFGPAPIGSGNFGYLPWIAGAGAGGYGLYKGIDWLADNLTNPDGTITGVNDPATQAAINSLPSEATSNRGNGNKGKAAVTETPAITPEETGAASTRRGAQGSGRGRGNGSGTATRNRGSVVPFAYDWYRNGSDGYSKPWGFTVGQNGLIDKNTGYTDDYRNLVSTLGAKDIKEWAKNHADDPSLRSFLDNNYKGKNYVEKLNAFVNDDKFTDDMWRRGATDGKYGFMHHVAAEIGKDQLPEFKAPSLTVPEDTSLPEQGLLVFDPKIMGNPEAMAAGTRSTITDPNGTKVTRVTGDGTSDNGLQRSPFKPKQTWTRYAPMVMSGIMGLKEMLTPADYGNADAITAAAYQAGSPVSIGTEYIGDYRKRDPFDERYLMNIINQRGNATNRNMMNLSGGNRAVAMSGILANDLTTQMALAEAARQAYLANRTDDAQVAEFNRGTNQFNATAQNQRNQFLAGLNSQRQQAMLSGISQGARLRQAIKDQRDAAISANLTNFAQGLGDLGKENGYYNMLGGLNEEGILKYFYGDDWKTKFNNVNV